MRVKAGDTVTLNLTNVQGNHDMVIDELDFHSSHLDEGDSETIELVIPEDAAGKTFEYYCSVGNHRQLGQVGTLIIE